ncbi:MAG TPA: LacI family DNA-binding transcriptional regulator [Bryobacteraceae bacterium]|nr:LacI family DNA-binding transcriptional regulator [Bryobacteraceae bacterium]
MSPARIVGRRSAQPPNAMKLETVAKRARVSTATVSRVLNGIDVVSASTKERVMRAVTDLDYHPNLHARTLAGGKSHTLGMIASNLDNPFFLDIYMALEASAHAGGYEVVIANTGYDARQLGRCVSLMIGRRVTGLAVVVSEMNPELMDQLKRAGIPTVFYDVGPAADRVFNIRVNYRSGIQAIVAYLHSLGHRRLAFVGHHSILGPTGEREAAFLDAVAGCSPSASHFVSDAADSPSGGRQAAREILSSGFSPTAIVCVNDFMAIGVLRELHVRGLRVPGDISVTGFDSIQLSEYVTPSLTTVHIPRERIGRLAYDILVPSVQKGDPPLAETVINPELIIRESTGPA